MEDVRDSLSHPCVTPEASVLPYHSTNSIRNAIYLRGALACLPSVFLSVRLNWKLSCIPWGSFGSITPLERLDGGDG
jgi:hypothetical protein